MKRTTVMRGERLCFEKMNIHKMTKKQFEELPQREWNEDIGLFDCLVILPSKKLHDSGYRCMDFVAVRDGEPICRLSGCSDVLHLDGIGGYGENWFEKYHGRPKLVPPSGWSIDCLPESGLPCVFSSVKRWLTCGEALSSFEVFVNGKRDEIYLSEDDEKPL